MLPKMTDSALAHLQPAMQADYNLASRNQSQSLQLFKPLLDCAIAAHSADLSSLSSIGGAFVIADFGCSTGLNSSDAVSHVITAVRQKYGWERCSSVLVVLNDLPRNPWGELFGFLHGDERSFLKRHRGVFAVSSGMSFYEQVMPDNSLHIGISNISLHWCSQLPVKMKDHCFSVLASDDEREMFRRQAAKDWTNFLTARSKELVSGGILALNVLTSEEEAYYTYNEIYTAAKALLTRGLIAPEELLNFNVPFYLRSLAEVTVLSQYESLGLELLKAERLPLARSVYYEDFLQHGDAQRFALEYSRSCRATCETTFLAALLPGRSDDDRTAACEELWRQHQAIVAERPENFEFTWATAGLVVRKL